MPPPIPNKDHEPITVSLAQILSLTFTLLRLKFLRGLAALCCFRSTHNCLVRAARRTEDAVVYHFLSIIPSSFYNPRVQIPLHALGPNIDGVGMGTGTGIGRAITDSSSSSNDRNAVVVLLDSNSTQQNGRTKSNQSPVMDISPSISPALRLSQRIPELAMQHPNRLPRRDSMIPPRSSTGSQYSSRGAEDGGALGSGSLIANMDGSGSLTEKPVSRISAEQFVTLVSTPDFSSANVSGQFVAESEEPQVELVTRPLSHPHVDLLAQSEDMQGLHLTRSVESYPGNFPVSEGLEYSGLATVPGHIRGRGTTSVRPFSDV